MNSNIWFQNSNWMIRTRVGSIRPLFHPTMYIHIIRGSTQDMFRLDANVFTISIEKSIMLIKISSH